MKTNILSLLVLCLSVLSCDNQANKSVDKNTTIYSGDFAGDPIDLTLTQIDDSSVKGQSSHLGHVSELSGKRKFSEKGYVYHLTELGTSRFEGTFDFELDTSINLIFGSWQLADTSGKHEAILYTLQPKLSE